VPCTDVFFLRIHVMPLLICLSTSVTPLGFFTLSYPPVACSVKGMLTPTRLSRESSAQEVDPSPATLGFATPTLRREGSTPSAAQVLGARGAVRATGGLLGWDAAPLPLHEHACLPVTSGVYALSLDPVASRNRFAGCAWGKGGNWLKLWDLTSLVELQTVCDHADGVVWCEFSRHGKYLASASMDSIAIVYDAGTMAVVSRLLGHAGGVRAVSFHPSGTLQAEVALLARVCVCSSTHNRADHCAIRAEEQVVTCSQDSTVRVWDCATGSELKQLRGHTSWVRCCQWSPLGDCIVSW
jgi:hypothetical protein